MKESGFFAMLWRMKYIYRWGLMRSTRPETLSDHTLDVAYLAHGLGVLGNTRLGKHYDLGQLTLLALYHDCSEILTGDMPTPVKYGNAELRDAYKRMEAQAGKRLLKLLPAELRPHYEPLFTPQGEEARIVKAADKLSALIKCKQEVDAGNREFAPALEATRQSLEQMQLPEAELFLEEYLPAYGLSLDELAGGVPV